MEKKRLFRGLLKLMLAVLITCGVGVFLMGTEVKADDIVVVQADTDGSVSFASDGSGGVTFTVVDPTGTGKAVEKVEVLIDGKSVSIYNSIAGTTFSFSASEVINSLNDTNKFTGSKNFSAKYSLNGDSSISRNATGTASTAVVSCFKKPTVEHATVELVSSSTDKFKKLSDDIYAYAGAVIKYTATPDSGYYVSKWSNESGYPITPDTGTSNKDITVTVSTDKGGATFTPTIKQNPPTIEDNYLDPSSTSFTVGSSYTIEYILKGTDGKTITDSGYSIKWTKVSGSEKLSFTAADGNLTNSKAVLNATAEGEIKIKAEVVDQFGNVMATPSVTRTFTAEAASSTYSASLSPDPYSNRVPAKVDSTSVHEKQYNLVIKKDGVAVSKDTNYKVTWTFPSTSDLLEFSTGDSNHIGDLLVATSKGTKTGQETVKYVVTYNGTKVYENSEIIYVNEVSTDTTVAITAKSSSGTTNPTIIDNTETIAFTGTVTTSGTTTVKSYRWVIYNENNKAVYDPGTKSSTSKEFSLFKVGKSSLGSAGTFTTEITITDSAGKTCTASYSFVIDEPDVEITKLAANNTYVTNGESTVVQATFTLSEGGTLDADEIADTFSFEFGSSSYVEDDATVLVSFTNSKKTTGVATIGIKGKAAGSTKVTIASDLYDDDEIEKTVYVLAPPAVTTDYKTDNHTVKFTIPTYLGSVYSPNMGVTGYRLLIYQGDTLKKTLDRVTTTSKEIEVNVEEILDKIDLTGDSYTFKLAIQPIGKCNWGTSDVSDAIKSTKDVPMVAKTSDITAYKVALTAGADVTVSPSTKWGLPNQKINLTASTSKAGADSSNIAWTKTGNTSILQRGSTYSYTVTTTTADNKLTAQLSASSNSSTAAGGAAPGTNSGSAASTEGLDDVPKTAESNAPIWLIIVLVFAAMGGAYALYMQMRPATVDNAPSEKNGSDDDYDDNF